jgi:hypothetical protein
MGVLRTVLLGFGVTAMVVTVAALLAAAHGNVTPTRIIEIPVAVVVFPAWLLALLLAAKVARGSKVDGIPGLAHLYGLGVAAKRAPPWAITLAVIAALAVAIHGASGRVQHMAVTPTDAKITCAALLGFLIISVLVLASRHPVVVAAGGLTTHSSGP